MKHPIEPGSGLHITLPAVSGSVTVRITAQLPDEHQWDIAPGITVKAVAAEGSTPSLPEDGRARLRHTCATPAPR